MSSSTNSQNIEVEKYEVEVREFISSSKNLNKRKLQVKNVPFIVLGNNLKALKNRS